MTWQNRIAHLEEAHKSLDKRIDVMERTGVFGDDNIHDLKKQRLHLKDEIVKLKAQHNLSH